MDKKNKKIIFSILMVLVLTMTIYGCKKENIENEEEEMGQNVTANTPTKASNELVERAENIADDVVDLLGVEDATAIIYNEQVIVAVKLSEDVEFSQEMKDMIKNVVLQIEPEVKGIYIVNDEKSFDKLDTIAQDLIKGKDIKEYSREIDKILKKVTKEEKDD